MMFDFTFEQIFNIKLFKTIANEELLFSNLFPTAELLFEKLYTQYLRENYLETPCNKLKRSPKSDVYLKI